MKLLKLIIHQVNSIIKHHTLFCVLLVIAQLLGILILLFSATTIQSLSLKKKNIDEYSLYFEVELLNYSTETEEYIIGYSEDGEKKEPIYGTRNKLDYSNCLTIVEIEDRVNKIISENPIDQCPKIMIYGKFNDYTIGTFIFDDSKVKEGLITLNNNTIQGYQKGDIFQLDNKELKVDDIKDNMIADMHIAPSDIPIGWLGYKIRFTYNSIPTTKQADEMKKLLTENFNCNEMHIPETVDPITAQFNSMAIICTFLMLIAVLLNICYAQLYRFRLAKRSFAVSRLVGGNVSKICSACYSEIVFSSLILYFIGAAIFHFLLKGAVSQWYEGADTLYTIKYYLLFGCAYLAFQLILISFPLKRFINIEVAVAEKEVE